MQWQQSVCFLEVVCRQDESLLQGTYSVLHLIMEDAEQRSLLLVLTKPSNIVCVCVCVSTNESVFSFLNATLRQENFRGARRPAALEIRLWRICQLLSSRASAENNKSNGGTPPQPWPRIASVRRPRSRSF